MAKHQILKLTEQELITALDEGAQLKGFDVNKGKYTAVLAPKPGGGPIYPGKIAAANKDSKKADKAAKKAAKKAADLKTLGKSLTKRADELNQREAAANKRELKLAEVAKNQKAAPTQPKAAPPEETPPPVAKKAATKAAKKGAKK